MLTFLLPDSALRSLPDAARRDVEHILQALSEAEGVHPHREPPLDRCEAVGVTPRASRFVFAFLDERERPLKLLSLEREPLLWHFDLYRRSIDNITRSAEGSPVRGFEALDLGRRVVHNEAAELLQETLGDVLSLDLEGARRLFTVLYLLEQQRHHLSAR